MRENLIKVSRVLLVIGIISIIVGVSYAGITGIKYIGLNENKINNCKIDVSFKEGKGISLTNTYPMDYVDAKSYSPYTFYIKNNSSSCDNLKYKITMENTCTGDVIDDEFISYELTNVDTGEVIRGDGINTLNDTFKIRSGSIDSYEMRIWINEKATNDDLYIDGNPSNPKKYCGRLNAEIIAYEGTMLRDLILGENNSNVIGVLNESSLKTTYKEAGDTSGIYESFDTNSGRPTYYFRGNVENNYVSFANFTWKIVRINENGSIRLLLSQNINTLHKFNSNFNNFTYMYYSNSDVEGGIKRTVDTWYNENLKNYENYIADTEFCEQFKVAESSSSTKAGSTTVPTYENYVSSFKCSTDANGYGILNLKIGLLTYDEAVHAGSYYGKNNDSYLVDDYLTYHLMSPAGFTNRAFNWFIYNNGKINLGYVSNSFNIYSVISLKPDTLVTGQGTITDPYIVK